jgi:hypothetical protein
VVSLILHGLLILGYRYTVPPPVEYVVPTSRMTVWLQPLRPTLPPRQTTTNLQASAGCTRASPVTVDKHTLAKSLRPVPAEPLVSAPAGATEQHSADTQAAAADKASKASNPGDPLHPETATGRFDMQAALKMARKEASRKDPARAAMPVSQLDDHPLYPEQNASELARNIDSAKRPSCLKGGSIFSPLIWLMDKRIAAASSSPPPELHADG